MRDAFPGHGEAVAHLVLARGRLHEQPCTVQLPHAMVAAAEGAPVLVEPVATCWASEGNLCVHNDCSFMHAKRPPQSVSVRCPKTIGRSIAQTPKLGKSTITLSSHRSRSHFPGRLRLRADPHLRFPTFYIDVCGYYNAAVSTGTRARSGKPHASNMRLYPTADKCPPDA